MATLVVKGGDLAGTTFPVQSEAVLGRVDADVTIADAQISRRHLKIYPREDYVEIEDLGSTNGTWLNGRRLQGRMRMGPGDSLRVGETTLELEAPNMTAGGTVIGAAPDFEELKRQADAEKVPPVPPAFGDAPLIEEHPSSKPEAPEAESPVEPEPSPPQEAPPYEPPAAATPTWGDAAEPRGVAPSPPGWGRSDEQLPPPAWGGTEHSQQAVPYGQGSDATAPMPQTGQQQQQGGYQSGGYAPPGGFGQQPQGYGAPGAPFAAKTSDNNRIFIIIAAVVGLIIVALAVYFLVFAEATLDTAPIESQIEENLAGNPNAQVDQVDCPDDVTVEEGGEFQCTASGPGGEFTVNLVQEDEEGTVRIVGVE
ncbi:MAG: FHA domain-containing protein [Actinomycetota bacterium]|nr:FHA domain-containing protein [Actinomycetota bacterium]